MPEYRELEPEREAPTGHMDTVFEAA